MTDLEVRDWYGVPSDAYLPRRASDLHKLAVGLYAAWRSFESGRTISPRDEFAPAQFFHVATELCSMEFSNRNFQRPEHILWPKTKS